jgi:Zn-dependent peptidase ImmA (M78 family)/DNA-binding XRE family transcriptional regulator
MHRPFNGQLLSLARQIRRVSQSDLVTALSGAITQGTLSKIERGRIQPSDDLAEKMADALRFRPSFFFDGVYVRSPPMSYHRKRQKLAAKDEESIHGLAEVFRVNIRKCLDAVEIEHRLPPVPAIDLDEYSGDVDEVASVVRQRWSLPRGPIEDLTRIVEDAGVLIVAFDFGSQLVDGFCQFACDGLPPFVFINNQQPKDRYRFSLAHELGHLILHQTPNPQQEIEANRFASEFLMPTKDISPDLDDLTLTRFMDLKMYWGVSMQALIYKAWQIGKLSDRMFKYYNIEMSKRGFRKTEPVEATHLREEPSTLRSIISAHLEDLGFSMEDLSDLFGLRREDLAELYPIPRQRPRLRLIRNEATA